MLGQLAVNTMGLPESEASIYIAISHDCDIANDDLELEPEIEFMRGTLVSSSHGNFSDARNARTLCICVRRSGDDQNIKLKIRDRHLIKKTDLLAYEPNSDWNVETKERDTLQWWLASRYFRSAFSDSFETRLEKVKQKIDAALKGLERQVMGLFFLVDDGNNHQLGDLEVHELRVKVVYEPSISEDQRRAVENAANRISSCFTAAYFVASDAGSVWQAIELVGNCELVSTHVFSYADQRSYKCWRLEHRSLREGAELPRQN